MSSDSTSSESAAVPVVVPAEPPSVPAAAVEPVVPAAAVEPVAAAAVEPLVAAAAAVAAVEVKEAVAEVKAAIVSTAIAASKDPVIADDLKELLKVLTDKLQKKPESKAEMTKLYHDVSMQLSTYLVKQLPPMEQKAALTALWAVEQVETASVGCFGLRK
jgi:hypothetical protein